ncbi:hypothetical protein F5884DRAFT_781614 [Xylogone sp. PMI_703]|nr:hypothetical protein F5884DRAFT_781614 [Xylogone sp. PMI_703]
MVTLTVTSLPVAISCLALVTLLSIPSAWQCVVRIGTFKSQRQNSIDLYEDEDGLPP